RITLIAATKALTKSLDHNTSAGTQRVLFCIFAPTQDGYFHPEVGAFLLTETGGMYEQQPHENQQADRPCHLYRHYRGAAGAGHLY
ncbi:MAG: hypothetical protein J6J63_05850, partial [Oscillospiraceae bacterium]|nr:hypothetical protein [Oscillospiraceae bacterium]